jgi:aminopeptidase N
MDEFLSTLEEGSGQSLLWFREEWLERRGVPTISLKSEIQKSAEVYNITCVLEQIGNIYRLPVEIGIQTEKGMHMEKVLLKERLMTFSFSSREKPQKILLDPQDWIIMKKI